MSYKSKFPFKVNDALFAIVIQALLVFLLSPLVGAMWDKETMGSFLLGGLICVLPNSYLYCRVFAHFGARAAKHIVRAFYMGESVKILITAACFVGAIMISWTLPLWVFIGYIIASVGFGIGPIILGVRNMAR